MKIVTNEKLIRRNRRLGQYLSIGSLVILGVGLYISFRPEMISLSFLALIIGFMLSQVGIYFGNRWGRSPRPDEIISASLKGLDNRYTLYHYTSPVMHLLVGPAGMWILLPYSQRGNITYEKGRWRQKGGNWYLKLFAQEGLGRPDMDARSSQEDMKKFIAKLPEAETLPAVNTALVFTNPKVAVDAPEAPIPTMAVEKLKDFIRLRTKEKANVMSMEQVKIIESALPGAEVEVPKPTE